MDADDIRSLYDLPYASTYDERYLDGHPWCQHNADYELELLGQLLDRGASTRAASPRWLDVACGTGWYLQRFDGVPRAGLDISPGMLEIARSRNPDAELREGSFLDDHADWTGRWDVVSCLWYAYCYAGSLDAVEQVIDNLVRWTAPGGSILLAVCDLEILAGGRSVPYEIADVGIFGGPVRILSVVWDYVEKSTGKHHEQLVAPHPRHLMRLLREHFADVSLVTYPEFGEGGGQRRAIVARGKGGSDSSPEPAAEASSSPSSTEVLRRRGRYWRRRIGRRLMR